MKSVIDLDKRRVANQWTKFYSAPAAKNPTPVVVTLPLSWLQMLHWVARIQAEKNRGPKLQWLQARWAAVTDLLREELERALAGED